MTMRSQLKPDFLMLRVLIGRWCCYGYPECNILIHSVGQFEEMSYLEASFTKTCKTVAEDVDSKISFYFLSFLKKKEVTMATDYSHNLGAGFVLFFLQKSTFTSSCNSVISL